MVRNSIFALAVGGLLASTTLASAPGPAIAQEKTGVEAEQLKQAPPAIRVVAVQKHELVETISVNGTILPRDEAVAGTDLNGMIVLELNADQGDLVKKGEVLAVLDRSMLDTQLSQMKATRMQGEASVAQMEAQIGDARVGVKQAEEAFGRAEALAKKGFATQADLDNARNAVDSAKARQTSAEKAMAATEAQLAVIDAQIRNVEVQIDKTQVRAPADGLVLARAATIGGVVSPASGALFRLAVNGTFELEANVAETLLPRFSVGMKTLVSLPGSSEVIEGKIRRIAPEIDQKSRLGAIRITLADSELARAGSFARGEVEVARRVGLAVPASAIVYRGRDAFLQVVEDGKIKTVAIEVGLRAGGEVELLSGVTEGQEVVARAGTFVNDGDAVTPVRGEATGAIQK